MDAPLDARPLFVLGDVHGQYEAAAACLRDAQLIDAQHQWIGADARLWFIGDLLDRGPHGVETVELVMRLEQQAAAAGGFASSLLGNHEVMFLAAHTFGSSVVNPFRVAWVRNGGTQRDWQGLGDAQIAWMRARPAMVRERGCIAGEMRRFLLIHADALFYTHYGDTIEEVNAGISAVLHQTYAGQWEALFEQFIERMMFVRNEGARGTSGDENAAYLLRLMEADMIVHGHTPLQYLMDAPPTAPLVYANGQVVNIDGGMYLGGTGFVVRLDTPEES